MLAFVRSIEDGRVEGRERSVSASQAMSSRTHRTLPASASITSGKASARHPQFAIWGTNLDLQVEMPSGCLGR